MNEKDRKAFLAGALAIAKGFGPTWPAMKPSEYLKRFADGNRSRLERKHFAGAFGFLYGFVSNGNQWPPEDVAMPAQFAALLVHNPKFQDVVLETVQKCARDAAKLRE